MKTFFVTGGAGFIGSNFINYLNNKYKNNIFIINLDLLTYAGNLDNLKQLINRENYHFIKGDICDRELINSIFENYDIDYLVNFAAESHVDRSIKDSSIFVKTNVLGVQVLLDVAKKFWFEGGICKKDKRFLQISTDEVYGSLGKTGFFTEITPLDPHNPYSASKAGGDLIVKSYYDTFKMPVNITRCSNNYGPYQFPEKLIPLTINNCLQGKEIPLYGDGKNIRDWIYVEDHCKAIDIILKKGNPGEIYNIGGNSELENIDVIENIIELLNELFLGNKEMTTKITKDLISYVKDRKGHDRRYAIDAGKVKEELGWYPGIAFEEGIMKTIKWYLKNEKWLESIVSGEYTKYYEEMYNINQ